MSREIPLSRGMVALVDDADYERIAAAGPWHAVPGKRTHYARHTSRAGGIYRNTFMHTLVAGVDRPDHINGDGLDNRRANLRPATAAEQARNRGRRRDNGTGFTGVQHTASGRWTAGIRHDGRQHHLGTFDTAEQAARAYDAAALTYFGEFARPNFPQEIAS